MGPFKKFTCVVGWRPNFALAEGVESFSFRSDHKMDFESSWSQHFGVQLVLGILPTQYHIPTTCGPDPSSSGFPKNHKVMNPPIDVLFY